MATALRRLAKDYASGSIDREEYLRRRKEFVEEAISGRSELKEEEPRRAAPSVPQAAAAAGAAPEPAPAGRPGLLIGAAVVALIVIAGGTYLFWPNHKPKPAPATMAKQKGPDPSRFVKDFLARNDWGHTSVEQLVKHWDTLDAETRKQVTQSPSYGFLDDAIYEQIVEEQQLADLGDRQKAVAAQKFLAGVAHHLGMTEDRFNIPAEEPREETEQTAAAAGETAKPSAAASSGTGAAPPAPASPAETGGAQQAVAEAPAKPAPPSSEQTSAPEEAAVAGAAASGGTAAPRPETPAAPQQQTISAASAKAAEPPAAPAPASPSEKTQPAAAKTVPEPAPPPEKTEEAKTAKAESAVGKKAQAAGTVASQQTPAPESKTEPGASTAARAPSKDAGSNAPSASTTGTGAAAAGTASKETAEENKAPPPTATKATAEKAKTPVKAATKPTPKAAAEKQAAPAVGSTAAAKPSQASNRYACRAALVNSRRPYCRDNLADGGHGPVMVVIPAGSFRMGGSHPDEKPVHEVHIPRPLAFSMHEISFVEFEQFCKATGRQCPKQPWSGPEYPVVNVSWFDARAYTQWLSKETGRHYRLPSEAEWEYAARAGTTTPYPFGNEILPTSARFSYQTQVTTPLPNSDRSINRNRFRLYNMVGNVAEWVEDTWHDNYQGAPTDGQAELGGNPALRVVRGGSYKDGAEALRSAARAKSNADAGSPTIGFRVVEDLPAPAKSSANGLRNDSGWLRAQNANTFTLQLFAVRQPDKVSSIIRSHPDIGLKLVPAADGRFHYRLLYGVFRSRHAARTAFGRLPADIVKRAGKPVVKLIADLQKDLLATTR